MAVFTACTSDNDDNPASAVDDKEWKADANKDTSIRPGDDFFMYCNGGWWNNTKADDDNSFPKLFMGQIVDEMNRREAALTLPSKTKVLADAAQKDTAAVVAQKAKLQSALDRVNALTTKEEAWQLMAQLYMEGYRTPMELTSFAKKGKMVVALWPPIDKDYNALQLWSKQSMSWRLSNDPEMQACIRPLKSAATRGFDNEEWPFLVTFFNALGFSLDDVYTIDHVPSVIEADAEELYSYLISLATSSACKSDASTRLTAICGVASGQPPKHRSVLLA